MRSCVVMLTMNEEAAVARQVEEIRRQAGADIPIIIVNSSKDRTPEIAESMGVTVIRQFPPLGYGKAMMLAQAEAAKIADIIVILDCDMTYPADRIREFVSLIDKDGYDCVSGSRMSGKNEGMPLLNRLGNWAFASLVRVMFGYRITDLTTGMRAYRASAITSIEWVPLRFFPCEQGLRMYQGGYRVIEKPIAYGERLGTAKMQKVRDTLRLIRAIYHCWRVPVRRRSPA